MANLVIWFIAELMRIITLIVALVILKGGFLTTSAANIVFQGNQGTIWTRISNST